MLRASQSRRHAEGVPERIAEVTALLAEVLAPRAPLTVIVDGGDPGAAAAFASRLAAAFPPAARAWSVDAVLGLITDALVRLLERRALAWRRGILG